MNIYQIIMLVGAIILLVAQLIHVDLQLKEKSVLYEVLMIVGLLTILIPPIVWGIEIIRYHI